MAKKSMIQRDIKRKKLTSRFSKKREILLKELKICRTKQISLDKIFAIKKLC